MIKHLGNSSMFAHHPATTDVKEDPACIVFSRRIFLRRDNSNRSPSVSSNARRRKTCRAGPYTTLKPSSNHPQVGGGGQLHRGHVQSATTTHDDTRALIGWRRMSTKTADHARDAYSNTFSQATAICLLRGTIANR